MCVRYRKIVVCHIYPTPIRASKNFTIDFSGSKVFKCRKRNLLKAEKKGTKVFECQGQTLSWKIFLATGSRSFYLMPLLNRRQQFWSAGANMLTILGFIQMQPQGRYFLHETLQLQKFIPEESHWNVSVIALSACCQSHLFGLVYFIPFLLFPVKLPAWSIFLTIWW